MSFGIHISVVFWPWAAVLTWFIQRTSWPTPLCQKDSNSAIDHAIAFQKQVLSQYGLQLSLKGRKKGRTVYFRSLRCLSSLGIHLK